MQSGRSTEQLSRTSPTFNMTTTTGSSIFDKLSQFLENVVSFCTELVSRVPR